MERRGATRHGGGGRSGRANGRGIVTTIVYGDGDRVGGSSSVGAAGSGRDGGGSEPAQIRLQWGRGRRG